MLLATAGNIKTQLRTVRKKGPDGPRPDGCRWSVRSTRQSNSRCAGWSAVKGGGPRPDSVFSIPCAVIENEFQHRFLSIK
jgi:hypothetical protein